MFRADHVTAESDANGAGKDGYTDGDPGVQSATVLTADAANAFQEEIANAIEAAGITLSKLDKSQLSQAVVNLAARYSVAGSGIANGTKLTLASVIADTGYSVASNAVTVPSKGLYLVTFSILATASAGTAAADLTAFGTVLDHDNGVASGTISASYVLRCSNVADKISLASGVSNLSISAGNGHLSIVRLHFYP